MPSSASACARWAGVLALLGGLAPALTGCGAGLQAAGASEPLGALQGVIHGGNLPVVGATVNLYAANLTASVVANSAASGTGGSGSSYIASSNIPIATTTTGANGSFLFPSNAGNLPFTCTPGEQLYLTATGGNPGLAAGTNNASLFLVAAIGACGNVTTSTSILINEVTTVAAAYALAGFVPAGGQGFGTAGSPSAITASIATSATNTQGLTDAFLNAASLVNIATGASNATTPLSSTANGTGTVPQSLLNTLGNVLVPCINSTGAGSACTALYTAANPNVTGLAAPINTFQAALDIAGYPGTNSAAVWAIYTSQPAQTLAFTPNLAAQPNDFTVAITYSNAQMVSPTGFAFDKSDNVYVSGSTNASLIQLSPQGVLSAGSQTSGGLAPNIVTANDNVRNIAIDPAGNLWLPDGGGSASNPVPAGTGVFEWVPTAAPSNATNYGFTAVDGNLNTYNIATDNVGNVWTPTYSKSKCIKTGSTACSVVEFIKGAAYTATVSYPIAAGSSTTTSDTYSTTATGALGSGTGGARGFAFDVKTGNVWTTDINDQTVQLFQTTLTTAASSTAAVAPAAATSVLLPNSGTAVSAQLGPIALAIDKASNAWVVQAGTNASGAVPSALFEVTPGLTATIANGNAASGLNAPGYLAIDGNNNIFIANSGGNSVVEYNTTTGAYVSGTLGFAPGAAYGTATAFGTTGGTNLIVGNKYIGVDLSGALWTQDSAGPMVQIFGIASPTQPILSLGGYGAKP